MIHRKRLVYGVLIAVWAVILAWQIIEHHRVLEAGRAAVINRSKDISTTLGLVMRSQRRFGVISKDRLASALGELIHPGELNSIALLNATGEVVVSAGPPIDFSLHNLAPTGAHWTRDTVTLMNLVDLGASVPSEFEGTNPPIILAFPTNRPSGGRSGQDRPPREGPPPPEGTPPPERREPPPTNVITLLITNADGTVSNAPPRPRGPRRGEGGPAFGRPFWMTEQEYREAIQKQGAHSVAMVLSTQMLDLALGQDLWLRFVIMSLAALSVVAFGLAWRNLTRSSELEVRLVRASELNARLKEMNLAAAGLAHETKNPLNIIRGLAQLISRQEDAPGEVRQKSRSIVEEADRVTAQLNEFINYSRPREVRRSNVALSSVVGEVVRTLTYDLEEKSVNLKVAEDLPGIEADEPLLRQALFNLLLNAVQAVDRGGAIEVTATRSANSEVNLEIRDNGPGVPMEHRQDIFKPYFTKTQNGTGLGLAVVQQIVLAHGWEITCVANEPRGALFRLSHLRPTA
jgi:signal transduction histidine kinase